MYKIAFWIAFSSIVLLIPLSIYQVSLLWKLAGLKRIGRFEMYKFLWPFHSQNYLIKKHAETKEEELLIKQLCKVRIFSTILLVLILLFFSAVLLLALLAN